MQKTASASRDQVQSVVRALALLNRLAEAEEAATLTELAQQVGLSPSTAHRLLATLEQERYVRFDAERRAWTIGVQAFVAGSAFVKSRNIVALARPRMRALMEASGETVNLAVEDRGEAIYLAQVECRQMMRAFARPGAHVPLHCSSVGKALLAAMPELQLTRILHRHGLPRLTVKTRSTPAALRADLAQARSHGYALDDEEHAVGLRCVASVVFDENAEAVAAVAEVPQFTYLPSPIRRRKAFSNAGGAGLAVAELAPRDSKACAELEALIEHLFNIHTNV